MPFLFPFVALKYAFFMRNAHFLHIFVELQRIAWAFKREDFRFPTTGQCVEWRPGLEGRTNAAFN